MIITVNISWVRDSQRLEFEVNESYKTTLAYHTETEYSFTYYYYCLQPTSLITIIITYKYNWGHSLNKCKS